MLNCIVFVKLIVLFLFYINILFYGLFYIKLYCLFVKLIVSFFLYINILFYGLFYVKLYCLCKINCIFFLYINILFYGLFYIKLYRLFVKLNCIFFLNLYIYCCVLLVYVMLYIILFQCSIRCGWKSSRVVWVCIGQYDELWGLAVGGVRIKL